MGEIDGDGIVMLANKQWINTNNELQIEYIYKLEYNTKSKGTGILIFNSKDFMCDYFEIGISFMDKQHKIYLAKWLNGVYHILQKRDIQNSIHYKLNIVVINGYKFRVELNGKQYLEYINYDHINKTINDTRSGYIALFNYNVKIIAKSLYISGSAMPANNS